MGGVLPLLQGKQHVNRGLSPQQRGDVLQLNLSIKPQEDLLHKLYMDPLGPLSPSHHHYRMNEELLPQPLPLSVLFFSFLFFFTSPQTAGQV